MPDSPEKAERLHRNKILLFISNVFSLLYLYFSYIERLCILQIEKLNGKIHEDEGIVSQGMLSGLIMEFLLNLVQPLWFLHSQKYHEYHAFRPNCDNDCHQHHDFNANDVLLFFSIYIKLIPVLIFIIHSKKTNPKSVRCASIFGVETDFVFSLKMWMV